MAMVRELSAASWIAPLYHTNRTSQKQPLNVTVSSIMSSDYAVNQTFNMGSAATIDSPAIPVIVVIQNYLTIAICVLGLIGNSFSCATFLSKQLRRSPCSVYLAVRGFSDNIFLASVAVEWSGRFFGMDFAGIPILCKAIVFLTYISSFVSVWLTIFVTFENLVLLKHPNRAIKCGRNTNYKWLCVGMAAVAVCLYVVVFWLLKNDCSYSETRKGAVEYFVLVDMVVTFVTPFITIIVLLTLTVSKMIRINNTRVRSFSTSSTDNLYLRPIKKSKSRQPVAKVTIMLFIFTLTFILLHLPSQVLRSYVTISSKLGVTITLNTVYISLHSMFQLLHYLSYSINVIVFIGFGSNFRKLFLHNFCGFRTDVTAQVLDVARYRRQPQFRRRHTITGDVIELASITLSREWFNLDSTDNTQSTMG